MADDTQPVDDSAPDFDRYWTSFMSVLADTFGVGQTLDILVNTLLVWVGKQLGWFLRILPRLASYGAKFFQATIEQSNPEFAALATSTLGTLFGSDVSIDFGGVGPSGGGLADSAEQVGAAVLKTIFGNVSTGDGGGIQPDAAPAERFLGAVTEMVMRGWFVELIAEMVPVWNIKAFHELEEELIGGLGIGRLMRTALRPYVQHLIATPLDWQVNLAARPRLASEANAIRMWQLGHLDDATLDDVLGRQGYGADHIDSLKVIHTKHPGVADLAVLYGHHTLTDSGVTTHLVDDGYDQAAAQSIWEAAKLRHFDTWIVRQAEVWLKKLDAGIITIGEFNDQIASLGLFPGVDQLLTQIANAELSAPRRTLSVAELFTALENNILTQNEIHDYLIRLGYSEDDSTTLLLTRLAIGKHKTEVDQQRQQAQAARAAAKLAAQQQRQAAAAEKAAAAAAARAQKAAQLAAQKAAARQNAEQRRQFIANAAEQKRQLAAGAHAAGQINADQLQLANAQIEADTAELLATATAHDTAEQASFEQQLLDLRQANREADLQQQLADVDLALEPMQQVREQGVTLRLQNVDTLLTEKQADIDQLYSARAQTLDDNLAAELAAVDVRLLPTKDERAAAAAAKTADLDATLARKLQDIDAEYDDKQASVDSELAAGTITQKTHDTKTDTITNGRAQAKRAAQQSHDLSVQALQTSGSSADGLSVADATNAKQKLQDAHDAAVKKLGDDKLAAQLAAQQAADKERLNLQVIQQQIGPITQAEAARRRLQLQEQDDAAKKNEQVVAVEIAKASAQAADQAARAATTADAARQRLQALQTAVRAREAATTANNAASASLAAQLERQREDLERTIAASSAPPTSSVETTPAQGPAA